MSGHSSLKIEKIIIRDVQQFKDVEIDLTYPKGHPKEGQVLDRVCFIGKNGTGKSTLLKSLADFLKTFNTENWDKIASFPLIITLNHLGQTININYDKRLGGNGIIEEGKVLEWHEKYRNVLFLESEQNRFNELLKVLETEREILFKNEGLTKYRTNNAEYDSIWLQLKENQKKQDELLDKNRIIETNIKKEIEKISSILLKGRLFERAINNAGLKDNKFDIVIYSPAEVDKNELLNLKDVPQTSLNDALSFFNHLPYYFEVSNENAKDFWTYLIFLLKKREDDFREFEQIEENQNRTVKDVRDSFDKKNQKILEKLADLWNKILEKSGLEFDYEGASNPTQLNDNLKAYIRIKATKQPISYHQLSTGIRNFIFKIGHIYSLYFNREINNGFLLIDEPENSLFPDFLYDLIDIYEEITNKTQMFFATHSPIIAAQFEPFERIILDFDDNGYVQVHKGIVPLGDDPNDILIKDFGVRSILGKEGSKKWKRFIELKTLIPRTLDESKKLVMIQEYLKIGYDYNFSTDAIS